MTDIGESVSSSGPVDDEEEFLEAEVKEVTFKECYKTAHGGSAVSGAHWPGGKHKFKYSKTPTVYQFGSSSKAKAEVKIKIDSKGVSGNGKVKGLLKGLEFEGEVPLSSGEHTVTATLKTPPDSAKWVKGDTFWGVEGGGKSAMAGTTFMEIFFVFDDPTKLKFFSSDGVWAEALRFVFENSRIEGKKDRDQALSAVTQLCFSRKNHKYEIEQGAPKFGGASGTFSLKNYIDSGFKSAVNCYDQAYGVIVLGGALGLNVDGIFIQPFGFLKLTSLVGYGACNNPFPGDKYFTELAKYSKAKSPKGKPPAKVDFLVVDTKDPDRSAFGNHMFCEFSSKTYDACAGPVKGDYDKAGYAIATIDRVYPASYPSNYYGTPSDMRDIKALGADVTKVE